MSVELATAYVSLVVSTDKIPKQVNSALQGVQGQADAAGKSMGSKLSSGLASTFKVGAVAGMAAAGGVAAAAFTKGFGRLTAIDDAQGKLKALGHDTAGVAAIMDSALASVKGTSYGLGDAAGIAASAVAAGIKPGQDLTRYLSLTADAASIAGTSLAEMGQIINKVQTSGTAYTMEITQLADRGLPIWQWLSAEMGVAQGEMKKLVSEGKIDSATYLAAIEKNIGGAATAATTVRSAYENMNAALGRVGAAALEPTFNRLTGWLQTVQGGFDDVTPAVTAFAEALDHKVFEEFGPKVSAALREFQASEFAVDSVSKLVTLFEALKSAGVQLAPPIQAVASSIAQAGATAGGAGFTVLLDALNGIAPILEGVLVPAIGTLSSLMTANQGVVTALLTAYAGFKLVSFLAATKGMQGLQTASKGAFASMRTGVAGMRDTRRMFEQTGNSAGRFATSMAFLSTGPGSIGKMASSFRTAQSSVTRFGGALGAAAAAAGTGMRIAAGGLMSALGGPAGLAIAGATAAAVIFGKEQAKAAEKSRELAAAAQDIGKALYESNGVLTDTGQKAAAAALEQDKLAGSGQSLLKYLDGLGVSGQNAAKGLAGSQAAAQSTLAVLKEAADIEAQANRERVGSKSSGFESTALGQLFNFGGGRDKNNEAQNALSDYQRLQAEAQKAAEASRRASIAAGNIDMSGTATALGTMRDTMSEFGAATGGAASKIDILNGGLASLRGDQMSVEDAQQRVNDSLRAFSSALGDGGAAAVAASGKIDHSSEAGSRLYDAMKGVQGAFDAAGAAAFQQAKQTGESQADIARAVQEAGDKVRNDFIAQAQAAGATEERAKSLADQYGLLSGDLVTNIVLNDKDARAQLETLLLPGTKEVTVRYTNASGTSSYNGAFNSELDRAQGGRLPKYAFGGRLPMTGPGTEKQDGFLGVTSDGQPIANVDKGEWVINRASSEKYDGVLRAINAGTYPKYAKGGIAGAIDAARSVDGNKYDWAGTGPSYFDCSGFIGWLQQIVMGVTDSVKRLYTTYSLIDGSAMNGLEKGLGPSGTLFRVGSSMDHMAGTIDGHAVESGGAHGTSGIDGGRAKAEDSQFPYKFHLPNSLIADYVEGEYNSGGNGTSYNSRSRSKSAPKWSDADEEKLTSAEIAVTQAEEKRDRIYLDDKKSQADKDQADSKVRQAQNKVVDLQTKKDDAANGVADGPAPQAPALEKAYTEQELSLIDAQLAVDDANERRNETYDNLDSTESDLLKADADLSRAKLALEEVVNGDASGGFNIKTRLRDYVTDLAGIAFDAGMAQLPFELGESRWWDIGTEVATTAASVALNGNKSSEGVNDQLGFNGYGAPPNWIGELFRTGDFIGAEGIDEDSPIVDALMRARGLRKNPAKVYDTGGWLEPGGVAVNLSDKPEPIFNSPKQLAQFAGGLNAPEAGGGVIDNSITMGTVTLADLKQFELMLKQNQMTQRTKAGSYMRR